jgi:hypothetical protein
VLRVGSIACLAFEGVVHDLFLRYERRLFTPLDGTGQDSRFGYATAPGKTLVGAAPLLARPGGLHRDRGRGRVALRHGLEAAGRRGRHPRRRHVVCGERGRMKRDLEASSSVARGRPRLSDNPARASSTRLLTSGGRARPPVNHRALTASWQRQLRVPGSNAPGIAIFNGSGPWRGSRSRGSNHGCGR